MGRLSGSLFLAAILAVSLGLAREAACAAPATQPYQWTSAPMGGGGFVDGLVYHPKQRGLLYARTDIGGAYRWDPAAKAWIALNDDLGRDDGQLMGALSLALDANDPQRVYIAAGEYTASWARTGALLASSDQGATWRRSDLPFKLGGNENGRSAGERLQVDPNKGAILLLGSSHDGLWKSDDYGKTWSRVGGLRAQAVSLVLFDPASGQAGSPTATIYVGTGDLKDPSLWRSRDGGANWEAVAGAPAGLMPHHAALDSDGALYLSYASGPGPNDVTDGAVWKLEPASGRWTDITPVKPGAASGGERFGYAGLAVDPQQRGVLMVSTLDRWAAGDEIFRSLDGGAHWTPIGPKARFHSDAAPWLAAYLDGKQGLGHWIGDVAIDPFDSAGALYGTGYGLWKTTDLTDADKTGAVDWSFEVKGLEEGASTDLISPPAGAHLLVALGDIGGLRYDQFDASPADGFFLPNNQSNRSVAVAELNPAYVTRTSDGAKTGGFWSNDGAVTWRPFDATPRVERDAGGRYHGSGAIAISAKGGFMVWAPEHQGGYASNDHGATWTVSAGWPASADQSFVPVADRAIEGVFYVQDQSQGALYISVDGGKSFQRLVAGLPQWGGTLRAVPGHLRDLWLPTPQGLFHSGSPSEGFKNLPKINEAFAVGFGAPAPGQTYPAVFMWGRIGLVTGLFRSDDEGASWVWINDDRHQFGSISSLTGDPRVYGRVYIGAGGRGVIVGEPATAPSP